MFQVSAFTYITAAVLDMNYCALMSETVQKLCRMWTSMTCIQCSNNENHTWLRNCSLSWYCI